MRLKKALIILFWLLVWQLAALITDNAILLASPIQSASALGRLAVTTDFWLTVSGSLFRIAGGFLLGFIVACTLAILGARYKFIEEFLDPVISLLRAVPAASFVVLLLICFGSSMLSVFVCFLIVLPIIYINVLKGIKNTDRKLLEMAAVFRMSTKAQFFYIYRPALRPFLESSLKLALGMCWKSGVAAEIIGTPDYSIGERIYMSKIYLDTADLFAWTAVVILLSLAFEWAFRTLVKQFMKWEPKCNIEKDPTESQPQRASAWSENYGFEDTVGWIQVQELWKSYDDLKVICNYNGKYRPGEIYYFTTPSGSGKTTLFRLITGLEQPDGGYVDAENIRFSYAFQEDRLCEEYSAIRNVELVTEDAMSPLKELLPEEVLHKPCSELSGGMRRRVAVVRAMEADSDCVILDEPYSGLDKENREKLEKYIRRRQNGRILLIASHIAESNRTA